MTYSYKTPVGTFVIRPQRTDSRRVELWIGSECYCSYASPSMAASDVHAHATGFSDWDLATNLDVPEDLGQWHTT